MNILITGGAGFIGSHVIEHHLNRGDEVVAVDDLSTGNRSNIRDFERNPRFRFVPSDITRASNKTTILACHPRGRSRFLCSRRRDWPGRIYCRSRPRPRRPGVAS